MNKDAGFKLTRLWRRDKVTMEEENSQTPQSSHSACCESVSRETWEKPSVIDLCAPSLRSLQTESILFVLRCVSVFTT